MAASLEGYVNHTVSIITADGRHIVGTLKGFDQTINLILDESHERVYSSDHGVEQVPLGLYIVRGDNVVVVGQVDDELDMRLDLANMRAEPLECCGSLVAECVILTRTLAACLSCCIRAASIEK
nr:U6 snRNA-associated Sm-like protein LSm8 [Rhipicephalus microplus]